MKISKGQHLYKDGENDLAKSRLKKRNAAAETLGP
jgi:hypothetical protein